MGNTGLGAALVPKIQDSTGQYQELAFVTTAVQ